MFIACPHCQDPDAVELDTGRERYVSCWQCGFAAGPLADQCPGPDLHTKSGLPMAEVAALVDALDVAYFLAGERYFGAGYTEILDARALACYRAQGQPWRTELATRFRNALDGYCEQWGVAI
jgi:hypothetical protein